MDNEEKRELKKNRLRRNMVDTEDDYEQELLRQQKRAKTIRIRITLIVILAMGIIAIANILYYRFYKYTDYQVVQETSINEGSFVGMERFGTNIIKYSRDGASYIDKNGECIWIDSYQMKSPKIDIKGDYAVVADAGGNNLVMYGLEGRIGNAKTTLPITKAVTSESGVCATVLEDNTSSYIRFYSSDGAAIDIEIKSVLTGDGYPIDISLAPSGTQLVVAYESIDGISFIPKVVFYDFSEIGKNVPNRLIGGFEEPFADSFLARVSYLNNKTSFVASDRALTFFSHKNISSPELVRTVSFENDIETLFRYKDHVGVVLKTTEGENPYKYIIYNDDGSILREKSFDFDYKSISADEDYVYLVNSTEVCIYNKYGERKYCGELQKPANVIIPGNWPWNFTVSNSSSVISYQFK